MRQYLKIGLISILTAGIGFVSWHSLGKAKSSLFVEMEVKGVRLDATSQNSVVLLSDKEEKKVLPIWIGLLEAHAIDREMNRTAPARPMTHDLLHSILGRVNASVKEVKIVELKEHTYYATLFLSTSGGVIEIDARPSDALILALKAKAPVFVATKILEEQGISLAKKEGFTETYGLRVQALTPSLASHFNFKGQGGVLVAEVLSGSVSETSGIKTGDIITKVNARELRSVQEFHEVLEATKGEKSIRVSVFRDERLIDVNLLTRP